jgi:hypothetical protein
MLLVLAQCAFIAFWFRTYMDALFSVRILLNRTIAALGYGWFISAHDIPSDTFLALLSECLVWLHVCGLCMAIWNRDSRFFKHTQGGCQEEYDG